MKSEEFVMQELEKERLQAQHPGQEVEFDRNRVKFMIAQEAPILMTKACELLVKELSVRAWQHTERNRRRTLQRTDLHAAVGESEVFDFLIDIVPRVPSSIAQPARQPGLPSMDAAQAPMINQLPVQQGGTDTAFINMSGEVAAQMQQEHLVQNTNYNLILQQMQSVAEGGTDTSQQVQLLQEQQQQQSQQQHQEQPPQWTDPPV